VQTQLQHRASRAPSQRARRRQERPGFVDITQVRNLGMSADRPCRGSGRPRGARTRQRRLRGPNHPNRVARQGLSSYSFVRRDAVRALARQAGCASIRPLIVSEAAAKELLADCTQWVDVASLQRRWRFIDTSHSDVPPPPTKSPSKAAHKRKPRASERPGHRRKRSRPLPSSGSSEHTATAASAAGAAPPAGMPPTPDGSLAQHTCAPPSGGSADEGEESGEGEHLDDADCQRQHHVSGWPDRQPAWLGLLSDYPTVGMDIQAGAVCRWAHS
jgi:hypothetical protein